MSSAVGSPSDQKAKGNDYAVEALKQLLTLATVVLALTITFMKDALGEARAAAQHTWLVPVAWLCLLVVIWLAWVAIGDAARRIASGEVSGYAFVGKKRWLVRVPHWCFFAALLLLAGFGWTNLRLLFTTSTPKVTEQVTAQRFVAVDKDGKIIWKAP